MARRVIKTSKLIRKILLWTAVIFLIGVPVTVGVMHAAGRQSQAANSQAGIQGAWQGTLHLPTGQQLRIVVKVSGTAPDHLKVAMYSIDQAGGQAIPANSASFDDGTFKYAIQMADANYEGKMSGDRNSISGTWKQGPVLPRSCWNELLRKQRRR